jgi:hypothetical protein
MADDKHDDDQSLFDKLIAVLLRKSWLDVLGDVCTPGTPVDRHPVAGNYADRCICGDSLSMGGPLFVRVG